MHFVLMPFRFVCVHVHSAVFRFISKDTMKFCEVAQSCPTLCHPMDCSPPGSSVHRISQARILDWVAISSSRGSSQPRDWTQVPYVSCVHWQVDSLPLGHLVKIIWPDLSPENIFAKLLTHRDCIKTLDLPHNSKYWAWDTFSALPVRQSFMISFYVDLWRQIVFSHDFG